MNHLQGAFVGNVVAPLCITNTVQVTTRKSETTYHLQGAFVGDVVAPLSHLLQVDVTLSTPSMHTVMESGEHVHGKNKYQLEIAIWDDAHLKV